MVKRRGKKISGYLKMRAPAGSATPAPPIGPALGQRGLNIQEFCRAFNERTRDMEAGTPMPVVVTIFEDRTFVFEVKLPPVTHFLIKAAGLSGGSSTPGRTSPGVVTEAQCRDIAERKVKDMNTDDTAAAFRTVVGTARSMGLEVRVDGDRR